MTSPQSLRSAQTSVASLIAKRAIYVLLSLAAVVSGRSAHATTATTTALSISSTSVPYKTPVTLTATVTANGSPVTSGLVLFCDASAPYCENNSSLLAMVQLTSSSATAVVKIGSGPQGVHSYILATSFGHATNAGRVLLPLAIVVALIGFAGPLIESAMSRIDSTHDKGNRVQEIWALVDGVERMLVSTSDAHRFGKIYRALQRAIENHGD